MEGMEWRGEECGSEDIRKMREWSGWRGGEGEKMECKEEKYTENVQGREKKREE